MSRPKIKSKVVRATLANKDVLDMFHGVLGTSEGGATLSVTHPKYLRIRSHVDRFLRLLAVLRDSRLMALFPGPRDHLAAYVGALVIQFAESFCAPDLGPYLQQWRDAAPGREAPVDEDVALEAEAYARVPPDAAARFAEAFAAVKKCSLVNTAVVTCKNLVAHKRSLQDPGALRDRFLTKGGVLTFCPLPDLPLNFRAVYIDERLAAGDREFVLVVLHKLYAIGHDVYEAVSAPDVDVGEFVEVIMSSIGEVRKHIPRCDQAFNKIIESVDLLKSNFGGYYKDYTASGNPTIIMENFVLDVSKGTNSSPAVTAQFRRIITHYRKLAAQSGSNAKLQSLFQQVDANFQELETKSKKADAAASSGSDSGDGEEGEGAGAGASERAAAGPGGKAAAVGRNRKAASAPVPASGLSAGNRRARRAQARAQAEAEAAQTLAGEESLADELDREQGRPPGNGGSPEDAGQ